ncbi:MAG: hypothetical protein CMH57_15200 [Myxococcales bacterium]|nr:hypothetical protein [Myxococcales bacterium]
MPVLVALVLIALAASAQVAQAQSEPDLAPLVPGGEVPQEEDDDEDEPPRDPRGSGEPWQHALGLRFGINYSVLDRPQDGPGEPTLLSGSAFTGPGFVVGPSWEVSGLIPWVSMELGLLYTRSTATGFEQRGALKREILLEVTALRLPVWAKLKSSNYGPMRLVGGLGVDALVGLTSSSTVREQNVPADEAGRLETVSVTALHLGGLVGVEFDLDKVVLPLTVHGSFNPRTGESTIERYEDYGGAANPGPYKMEFDYEVLVLLGVFYSL